MRINFSCCGRPVHGVLLRQPQETHTGGKDLEREVKIPVKTEQLCPPPLHRPSVQVSEAGAGDNQGQSTAGEVLEWKALLPLGHAGAALVLWSCPCTVRWPSLPPRAQTRQCQALQSRCAECTNRFRACSGADGPH